MVFEKLKQPVFNLFYIMTEGVVFDSSPAVYRKVIFLLFIDVMQVLRVMCSYRYGWTKNTTRILQYSDLVYLFTDLISQLIPRYSFFIIASVLVLVALMDSYYVVKLFTAGNVQTMWPVKLLRILVGALVTTLFSSVIKWLLIPVECLASKEKSFSSFVHNDEGRCTPWGMPELIVSIPTIVLSSAYIVFALGTSYLAFEINPLSRHPRAMYTGRIEMLFTANKVAVTILVYFSELITPVVVSAIFFLWTWHVFRKHLTVLPFHSKVTNNVRGGIYGMVLWFSVSTIVVASIKMSRGDKWDTEDHPGWVQPMQWGLVGFIPMAFLLGFVTTSVVQYRCGRTIGRLRGDFDKHRLLLERSADGSLDDNGQGDDPRLPHNILGGSATGHAHSPHAARVGMKRGAFEKFFDTEWESRRRFNNDWRASVIVRSLLGKRNKDDLGFMEYLVGKALEEHPESNLLQMLLLVLHRFVFRDASEAAAIQKALKLHQKSLPIDFQYILFAAERKSKQDMKGADMGQGAVSGISLMEFEVSIEKARKAHSVSVSKMREFWKHVKKRRNAGIDELQAHDLIQVLKEYEEEAATAKREYELLIEKYPQSVQLLRSYAQFCDNILNDFKEADARNKQAALLDGEEISEGGEEEAEDGNKSNEMSFQQDAWAAGSAATSENESYRMQIQKYLVSQREMMLGDEAQTMRTLHRRVQLALLALLLLATAGFALTDFYLFNDVALRNIELIDQTGLFRAYAISSNFLLRSAYLAALANNTKGYATATGNAQGAMRRLRDQHWSNYEIVPGGRIKKWYLETPMHMDLPIEDVWIRREYNYWNLANDYARRVARAAQTPMAEFLEAEYVLGKMSEEKQNVAFAYENTQTEVIPTFETMVKMYEEEVFRFGTLTRVLVAVNVVLNSLLVLGISFFIIKTLVQVMRSMESKYVFCSLALTLPRSAAIAIYKYYDNVELNMKIVEDEEGREKAERKAILATDFEQQSPAPSIRRKSTEGPNAFRSMKNAPMSTLGLNPRDNALDQASLQDNRRGLEPRTSAAPEDDLFPVDKPHPPQFPIPPGANSPPLKPAIKRKITSDDVLMEKEALEKARDAAQAHSGDDFVGVKRSPAPIPQALHQQPLTPQNLEKLKRLHQEDDEELAGGEQGSDGEESHTGGRTSRHIVRWLTTTNAAEKRTEGPEGRANARMLEEEAPKDGDSAAAGAREEQQKRRAVAEALGLQVDVEEEEAMEAPNLPPMWMVSPEGGGGEEEGDSVGATDSEAEEAELGGEGEDAGGVWDAEDTVATADVVFVRREGQGGIERGEGDGEGQGGEVDEEGEGEEGDEGREAGEVDEEGEGEEGDEGREAGEADEEGEAGEEEGGREGGEGEGAGTGPGELERAVSLHCRFSDEEDGAEGGEGARGWERWERWSVGLLVGERRQFRERLKVLGFLKTQSFRGSFSNRSPGKGNRGSFRGSFKGSVGSRGSFKAKPGEAAGQVSAEEAVGAPLSGSSSPLGAAIGKGKSFLRRMMFGAASQGTFGGGRPPEALRHSERDLHDPYGPKGSSAEGSLHGDERPESFHEQCLESLSAVIRRRQPWHSRVEVYVVAAVLVLAICILSMAYPARNVDAIVNMAPTTNQAGRRRYLTRSCAHFTRELVLQDGFSRMEKDWIASALRFHLNELKDADTAVRMGGLHDVAVGADFRNDAHNRVMYDEGCPWREDPEDCSTPGMLGRSDVNEHGLQYLLVSFFDAVETVLARYAPGSPFTMEWRTHEELADADEFAYVNTSTARIKLLTNDADVKFILSAFAGDVFNGLGNTLKLFHEETSAILSSTHVETRLMFGIYVCSVALLFYHGLFRKTMRFAIDEVDKSRNLVMSMPTHVLRSEEVHAMVAFFVPAILAEDEDGNEAAATAKGD